MRRRTYTTVQVRACDLRDDDVILMPDERDDNGKPVWRAVMDVWTDQDLAAAEDKYRGADGWSDDDNINYIRDHLSGQLGSYILVRHHVETPGVAEAETGLIAFRSCDLVTVQHPESGADDVDFTDGAAVRELVAGMPTAARHTLYDAIVAVSEREREDDILFSARQTISTRFPGRRAVGVLFTATPYGDNDVHYVNDTGHILFDDTATEAIDFGPEMNDLLTMRYGRTTRDFVVAVNLLDGQIATHEHGGDHTITSIFGREASR